MIILLDNLIESNYHINGFDLKIEKNDVGNLHQFIF